MTDYNDGLWHGWNGGECPVHPETVVEVVFTTPSGDLMKDKRSGSIHEWSNREGGVTHAFRVVKEHVEPREVWITGRKWFSDKEDACRYAASMGISLAPVLFREVIG